MVTNSEGRQLRRAALQAYWSLITRELCGRLRLDMSLEGGEHHQVSNYGRYIHTTAESCSVISMHCKRPRHIVLDWRSGIFTPFFWSYFRTPLYWWPFFRAGDDSRVSSSILSAEGVSGNPGPTSRGPHSLLALHIVLAGLRRILLC